MSHPPEAAQPALGRPETRIADAILQLQAAVLSLPRADEAAALFATRLAELLGFDRVSVGFVHNGGVRLAAMSHGAEVDSNQTLALDITAAMDEAIDQATTIALPALASVPRITLAHAALRRGGGAVYTIPLVNTGVIAGAVTLENFGERAHGREFGASELAISEHMVNLVGPVLVLKRDIDRSASERLRLWCSRHWQRMATPGELPFKLAVGGGLLLLALVLFVPMPYSISAPTRLEGSVQRALVAASDGFIQQTSVRPGDKVREGQVLAELAQNDLQLERSKRDSELAQHVTAYGTAFARADRSLLMVNQARVAEARAQLELVEQQIERAQIKAPFDGVVISGDLTQSLGSPVQRGAVLMVVAPADQYRLIVEVDERDIVDIKAGAHGRVALAAMPGSTFAFGIDRVMPLAASRDGRHFFEVEGRLDASGAALRPGLQGVARIQADSRPLAAMAFGRLLNWLKLRVWSWGWWG